MLLLRWRAMGDGCCYWTLLYEGVNARGLPLQVISVR